MARRSASAPWKLGETAYIPNICVGADGGTPTPPDSDPTFSVRDAAGLGDGSTLVTGTATALSGPTGGYYFDPALTEGNGFAKGENYYLVISYAISAVTYTDLVDIPVV
jgi:hypothetical protein